MSARGANRLARAGLAVLTCMVAACAAPAAATASAGFGPLSGPGGCLVAPGTTISAENGTAHCGSGSGLAMQTCGRLG